MHIRPAQTADAEQLLAIYAYYVKNTAISFEYAVPSLEAFQNRIRTTLKQYPYLVLESENAVYGYAYAGAFVGRAAYAWSCETSIYLDRTVQRQGYGRKRYETLEKKLQETGILNVYACIAYPERNDEFLSTGSADSHARLGFERVGTFRNCGYKFNRWYSMIWMEKIIGNHEINQKPRLMRNVPE